MPLQRLATRATPKPTKAAARYTPAGGAERCGQCRHYVPSSSCARIEGPVSAAGWCQLYSQQVTWRPRAGQDAGLNPGLVPAGVTLDLDFMVAGTLPPNVVFTRASTATYFDATGTVRTAASGAPRWDYDPVTHALRGLLIEEARTNVLLASADMSNAVWAPANFGGPTAPVVTANQATAPDGTMTASRIAYPAVSAGGCFVYQNFTATANSFAASVWLKGAIGGEQVYLTVSDNSVTWYHTSAVLTTSWQRFAVTTTPLTAANWIIEIGVDFRDASQSSKPAQTVYAWGAQAEQGAFPTSYIPTTAAAVTRAIEQCSIPISSWYTAATFTMLAEFYYLNSTSGVVLGVSDNGFADNTCYLTANPSGLNKIGAGQGSAGSGITTPLGVVNKLAGSFSVTQLKSAGNGTIGSPYNATMVAPAGATRLSFGNNPWDLGGPFNSYMRRARFWPRVLSNAEMQSVTT